MSVLKDRMKIAKRFEENFKYFGGEIESYGIWENLADNILSNSFKYKKDTVEVASVNLIFEQNSAEIASANINGKDPIDVSKFLSLCDH